jgi:hypothetical protein
MAGVLGSSTFGPIFGFQASCAANTGRGWRRRLVLAGSLLVATLAPPVLIDFEGLGNSAPVGSLYDGGPGGSPGIEPGPAPLMALGLIGLAYGGRRRRS